MLGISVRSTDDRTSEKEPPSEVSPHPATVHVSPPWLYVPSSREGRSIEERHAGSCCRRRIEMSFSNVLEE